jgi:hypothetical protein
MSDETPHAVSKALQFMARWNSSLTSSSTDHYVIRLTIDSLNPISSHPDHRHPQTFMSHASRAAGGVNSASPTGPWRAAMYCKSLWQGAGMTRKLRCWRPRRISAIRGGGRRGGAQAVLNVPSGSGQPGRPTLPKTSAFLLTSACMHSPSHSLRRRRADAYGTRL